MSSVNVSVENSDLPVLAGQKVRVRVFIDEPKDPDSGDHQRLNLVVSLNGPGLVVEPTHQEAMLPRHGDMTPVYFDVTARNAGTLQLCLSLYDRVTLRLLEEFAVDLPVSQMAESSH